MPLIHSASTLLLLPIHRRHPLLLLRNPPLQSFQPPGKLCFTYTTLVFNGYVLQSILICRARRWDDSNAESFTTQNFSYYNNFGDDYDDEDTDGDVTLEQWDYVLQEYIDSIWIFKVFRSYGWALPFILVPLVIINGPKSFLLALALSILQSTFSFALQKMWDGEGNSRSKKKTRRRTSGTVDEFGKEKRGNRKSKTGYKSWVESDNDSNFGGWDTLDNGSEFQLGSAGKRVGRSQKSPSEKIRLRERIRKSDTPLLLRLLIAVFPFLSSWTKIL